MYAVAQLVGTLRYKPESREFDFRWGFWNFSSIWTFPSGALRPWSRRNLWQKWVPGIYAGGKGGRCVGLTTLPPSCADWKSWEPQPSKAFRAYLGLYGDSLAQTLISMHCWLRDLSFTFIYTSFVSDPFFISMFVSNLKSMSLECIDFILCIWRGASLNITLYFMKP
jgi:hypothetical protein